MRLDRSEAGFGRDFARQPGDHCGIGRVPLPRQRKRAIEIGLDMQQYDADYASDEVAARVQRDVDDGLELGVQGTPTFYVDGEPLQPRTYEDFTSAIDAALASS
jgi:protein-disulfide isomerase